jgi:iduronate 2-sulfatase
MIFRLALLAVAVCAIASAPQVVTAQVSNKRPNVLFFAVDDLRTDIGCYGHAEAKTPHIDALASRGMVFRRAYCQQAVCSPSRTSLLTGLRPDSTKVYDLVTHFRNTAPDAISLPQHFRENGYYAVGMGKIFHSGYDDPKAWSEPHKNGPGEGYVLPENQQRMAAGKAKSNVKAKGDGKKKKGAATGRPSRGEPFEMADVPDSAYQDGSLADMAVAKLAELKAKEQPFFLAVGFLKPHLPFNSPKKYWDLYDPSKLKLADNPFQPKDAPPYAVTDFGELRNYYGVPQEGPIPDEMARKLIHAYRAATSFTDANVGKVMAEIDRLGLRDNTIVVLWGDHGWKLGEHASWCKHSNMENDTNAPLIISAPGVLASGERKLPDNAASPKTGNREADASRSPRHCDALVEFVDVFPTLCDLAGLSLPQQLEGTSMKPLLNDPARDWKTAAFSQYPRQLEDRTPLMGYAMKTDRYRFVEWRHRQTGEPIAHELYDHQTDPAENQNIASRPEHKELLDKLAAQLKAGWQGAKPR